MGARSIFISRFANFAAAHTWESVRFLFRRYDEWNWRYQDASIALGCSPNSAHINDEPLNFFMRTILENQYYSP
jgi:hypothetical protein